MYTIQGKQFEYTTNVKDIEHIRNSFNALTQTVYGFDFEQFYKEGYWQDAYIPHVLIFENNVVSNVSVNIMNFIACGKIKKYIQIGTVMTHPDFRNMGLSRFLIEKIIEQWKEQCDLIFLFANDSVIQFYPKFKFEKVNEYQLSCKTTCARTSMQAEKLDMSDLTKQNMFVKKLKRSTEISCFALENKLSLTMFYCTSFMKDMVYYLPEYDAIAIAEHSDDTLCIFDVFCEREISLKKIIDGLTTDAIKKVVLNFTPIEKFGFEEHLLQKDNSTLFILGEDKKFFGVNHVIFPVLSHA